MARIAVPSTLGDPGAVSVRELCNHWRVSEDTARAVIARHDLAPTAPGWQRYRWTDIWRIEGEAWVPAWDWADYRAPLLRPAELADLHPRSRSARTFRRLLAAGSIPTILLSPGVRRVRSSVFERVIGHV